MAPSLRTPVLPAEIETLLGPRVPELGPGRPDPALRPRLVAFIDGRLGGGRAPRDPQAAACCRAALWLWHDFLDESHAVSQTVDTPEGSWWHGIMHRREPDPGNAAYWFRRVGGHAVHPRLATAAAAIVAEQAFVPPRSAAWLAAGTAWDPVGFVGFCASASGPAGVAARAIAAAEWRLLFAHCHAAAWPVDPGDAA